MAANKLFFDREQRYIMAGYESYSSSAARDVTIFESSKFLPPQKFMKLLKKCNHTDLSDLIESQVYMGQLKSVAKRVDDEKTDNLCQTFLAELEKDTNSFKNMFIRSIKEEQQLTGDDDVLYLNLNMKDTEKQHVEPLYDYITEVVFPGFKDVIQRPRAHLNTHEARQQQTDVEKTTNNLPPNHVVLI